MPPRSAGLLLYRVAPTGPEAFLVHPGGPYFERRRERVWSLPKGLIEDDEDELAAAVRELWEETGVRVDGPFAPLGEIRYSNGKTVVAWACEFAAASSQIVIESNTFLLEWPPRSGLTVEFPEVDEGRFFDLAAARRAILPAQAPFLDRLVEHLGCTQRAARVSRPD